MTKIAFLAFLAFSIAFPSIPTALAGPTGTIAVGAYERDYWSVGTTKSGQTEIKDPITGQQFTRIVTITKRHISCEGTPEKCTRLRQPYPSDEQYCGFWWTAAKIEGPVAIFDPPDIDETGHSLYVNVDKETHDAASMRFNADLTIYSVRIPVEVSAEGRKAACDLRKDYNINFMR
jgi:hypothetical protein